jgi:hypothetical protein
MRVPVEEPATESKGDLPILLRETVPEANMIAIDQSGEDRAVECERCLSGSMSAG